MLRCPFFSRLLAARRPEYERARALILARGHAGLTQQQLAERMGTSQSAIARWESGKHPPGLDTLERWAAACGVRFEIDPAEGLAVHKPRRRTAQQRSRATAVDPVALSPRETAMMAASAEDIARGNVLTDAELDVFLARET